MQLDIASFETFLRGTTLVDFEPETHAFVVLVRNKYAQEMLQSRFDRMIKRVLGDVYGRAAEVKYLLTEEWIGQGEQSA